MKTMKKLISLLLVLMLLMSLAAPGLAAEPTYTITINAPEDDNDANTYDYQVYRLFNATYTTDEDSELVGISYTPISSAVTPEIIAVAFGGVFVLENGYVKLAENVTEDAAAAKLQENHEKIEEYAKEYGELVKSGEKDSFTIAAGSKEVIDVGAAGYYYITTTTGSLVVVNSVAPDVEVTDKNTVPTVTKTVDDDIVQAGDTATFTIDITVGKGAINYVLHDTMDTRLILTEEGITVTAKTSDAEVYDMIGKYTVVTSELGDNCTFEIEFEDGIPEGTVITVTYDAIVGDRLTSGATNTAWVTYGDPEDPEDPPSTPKSEVTVYNAEVDAKKTDGEGKALAGAGFVIKNDDSKYYANVDGTVYWITEEQLDSVAALNDDATLDIGNDVKVKKSDVIHMSNASGEVPAFTGLDDGTYTLVEYIVPNGYNKAADQVFEVVKSVDVTTEGSDGEETTTTTVKYTVVYTDSEGDLANTGEGNLVYDPTVVNNSGSLLPSTGGIGTTIFYVVGGLLMVGAAILFITKKRSAN